MTKHVVIVHQGEDLPVDEGYAPLRYGRLATTLREQGYRVTRLSPSFSHFRRAQRSPIAPNFESEEGHVHLVPTRSFVSSISAARFGFIADFTRGTFRFVRDNRDNIDAVLVGVPPPGAVSAVRAGLRGRSDGHRPRVVADIRDVWPDCLAVGGREKLEPLFTTIGRGLSQELRLADAVSAASLPMLQWAPRRPEMKVIPLGMGSGRFDPNQVPSAETPLRVCFISNHTAGFDFVPVLQGWRRFVQDLPITIGHPTAEFVFVGAEPADEDAHRLAVNDPTVVFLGRIPPSTIGGTLSGFDVGLAPTAPRFADSLGNKVFDYFASGLHVPHTILPEASENLDGLGLGTYVPLESDAWAEYFTWAATNLSQLRSTRTERIATAEKQFGIPAVANDLISYLGVREPAPPPQ